MLNTILKELGLSDKEISVYLAVLKHGKISPAKAAIVTGLKRTTVYSVAKDLVKKGLMAEDLAGPKGLLAVNSPEDIKAFVQAEERELENKKRLAYKAVELAKEFISTSNLPVPKITYIAEKDLSDYVYKRTKAWHQS
ncbi:MAG TPA: helix-turn-helix domain-containing protein, partial [Patescibacteria group bacterium]|nr:helix-turn-helix domain-containing protein [Patescibacteria group bacterium]